MPFTRQEFFDVFAAYNLALWPLPILAYLLGAAVLALTLSESRGTTALICAVLGSMWLVNGIGYHWHFFAEINPVARGFAALFVVQAGLLLAAPLVWPGFRIAARRDGRTAVGLGLAVFALVVYPIWGRLAGHAWPAVPVFGLAPCPTTIFTIGLLLLGTWRAARRLLVIPALWAAIGGSAAVLLGVPQDFGLIAALLIAAGFAFATIRSGHREGPA